MPRELGVDRRSPREKRLETEGGGGWRGVPPRSRARAWGLVPEPPALNVFHALGPLIRALCTINSRMSEPRFAPLACKSTDSRISVEPELSKLVG